MLVFKQLLTLFKACCSIADVKSFVILAKTYLLEEFVTAVKVLSYKPPGTTATN